MRGLVFLAALVIPALGCAREPPPPPSALPRDAATNPSTGEKGAAPKMDEVQQTIKFTGFDPKGEPAIRVMGDGSLLVVFNFMPPSWAPEGEGMGAFADFDKQLERAAGVPVVWDDREVFVIQKPKRDTVERIRKFIESYQSK